MLLRCTKPIWYVRIAAVFIVLLVGVKFYYPKSTASSISVKYGSKGLAGFFNEKKYEGTWTDYTKNFSIPNETHHQIYSVSMPDKKYFRLDFHDYDAINPNIIPHPHLNDTWIMVGQLQGEKDAITGVISVW
jgi:hypothetical protein